MDENLLKKLDKITIRQSESICISLDDEDIRVGLNECNLNVFVHIFGGKDICFQCFKVVMCRA